jgi:hypothetical protein
MIWFVALGLVVQAGINWWLIQRARAARNDNRTLVRSLDTAQRVAAQAVTPEELQTKLTGFGLAWQEKIESRAEDLLNDITMLRHDAAEMVRAAGVVWEGKLNKLAKRLDIEDESLRGQIATYDKDMAGHWGDVEARVTALEQRAAVPPPKKEPAPRRAATGAQAMRMIETAVAAESRDDADKQDVGREG